MLCEIINLPSNIFIICNLSNIIMDTKDKWWNKILEKLFRPSSLITIILILVIIKLPRGDSQIDENVVAIYADAIKILAGALAGAVAGEQLGGNNG